MTTHPDFAATLEYLYARLPMFQRVGAVAYKKDLSNTLNLCKALGNPHERFPSIHVAGTNGKGSTSHMIAAILQSAGYRTGLYTSPHLKEFTERIRVNGVEVGQAFVVDFVKRMKVNIERVNPSFFETTVVMAFDYFAQEKVDVAVVEVGLGGRLDSTNVITPVLSLITNIGFDHMDLLGNTLGEIASEKAGIIKHGVPVVISQRQPEVEAVFKEKASATEAPLLFASDRFEARMRNEGTVDVFADGKFYCALAPALKGLYQLKNIPGVLAAVEYLNHAGWSISGEHVQQGVERVTELTGLKGRWQKLGDIPLTICDTAHNEDGIREVCKQIQTLGFKKMFVVLGMVKDKDISRVLALLPREAHYIFCQALIPRALPAKELAQQAEMFGLQGEVVENVNGAIRHARALAGREDFIFVGGSTFVVAEIEGL